MGSGLELRFGLGLGLGLELGSGLELGLRESLGLELEAWVRARGPSRGLGLGAGGRVRVTTGAHHAAKRRPLHHKLLAQPHLQPYVREAATVRNGGCRSYATQAAIMCDGGCNRMQIKAATV